MQMGLDAPAVVENLYLVPVFESALLDEYGYRLCLKDPALDTQGLRFTPLSTPDALIPVGFLYRTDVRPSAQCRRICSISESRDERGKKAKQTGY